MLVHVEDELKHRVLGSTLDDAAGECFDKTGKLIGLPIPPVRRSIVSPRRKSEGL